MQSITRRRFSALTLALARPLRAANLDETLDSGRKSRGIPAVAAAVATPDRVVYHGAFGEATPQSIFRIASMTKPVTAVAAMQLVEAGKLKLDDPVSNYLPELKDLKVIDGFGEDGHPILRPAAGPVLLRHLLTHTSGFAYDNWDPQQLRYTQYLEKTQTPKPRVMPLSFDPGTQWRYGTSMDWTGRLVEAVTDKTLEAVFQSRILQPLGMKDTSFLLDQQRFERLLPVYQREKDGELKLQPNKMPAAPKSFNGGGGLYSTPEDYVKFMQMILHRGRGVLKPETVDLMTRNHVGSFSAGKLKSVKPEYSSDMDVHPGHVDGFGYGFLINAEDYQHGRAAGSLAWAGIDNTFFWIDPHRRRCAVIMMQYLPFCDKEAVGLLHDFERSVYS